MNIDFRLVSPKKKGILEVSPVSRFGMLTAEKALNFHKSLPGYAPTPLIDLKALAGKIGVSGIYVKDESFRFGLNAFKVLGGSYAIGRYIAAKAGIDPSELSFATLTKEDVRNVYDGLTLVTATDGNHGRGVAWAANRLGLNCVVYLPKGSSSERLENIRALGAEAAITDLNYDDAVRLARTNAAKNSWVVVQDTSWEGYEEIPGWIMEGYTTMALEAYRQLDGIKPTHIFLQAGVGAMAGAVTGFFSDVYGDQHRPVITIVEPNAADCIFRTAEANDGSLHFVSGDMNTIMAGLSCGEPCPLGWNILRDHADHYLSVPDSAAEKGMRILAHPFEQDKHIVSGESGAAAFGAAMEILTSNDLNVVKRKLCLDHNSRILFFSTEGDTDRENYLRITSAPGTPWAE